jgi:dTDP-glucose 4,6-dehydratase
MVEMMDKTDRKGAHRILVTGGAGFIGSGFVRYVLRAMPRVHVVVLDKLTYAGNMENLTPVQHNPEMAARLTFIEGDICDANTVREAMSGCDWTLNFAAETHVDRSIIDASAFVRTDVEGTYTLLEAARDLGVTRFVQISTDEVYGNAEAPNGESRPSLETDALKPLSPYAASKVGGDRLAFSYWATYSLPVVITRCSNNYGPYQYPEKQLPLFITNALAGRTLPVYGDGHNTRDWIHVDDHCAALCAILEAAHEQVAGEVFNVGTSEERSVLDNVHAILDLLDLPSHGADSRIAFVQDRLGHVRRHAVDATKLRDRLGWGPQIEFRDGLATTVAWYRENRTWLENVLARRDAFLDHALTLASSK